MARKNQSFLATEFSEITHAEINGATKTLRKNYCGSNHEIRNKISEVKHQKQNIRGQYIKGA
jgi:hypothetical protein